MPQLAMVRWNVPMLAALMICSFMAMSDARANDAEGTALARQVYDRPDGRDMSVRLRMTLTERGRAPRARLFYSYRQDQGRGRVRSLVRFIEPADVAGTGLLTQDTPGQESAQWLFLPAVNKERRISGSRKGGRFVGSDIYFEDLRDRLVEQDRHRAIGTDSVLGTTCKLLESVPVDPSNSVYSRRVSCIHPETFLPLRVEFFEGGKSTPSKRLVVSRIQRVQGYWTVLDSTMTDLASGHETRLAVEEIKYDQGLPESLFSIQALTDPARDTPYRP